MYEELNKAAAFYDYSLIVNLGGETDCEVFFNISSDGEDNPDWIVTEFQLFFLSQNVTKMVTPEQVEELIYEQSREVEDQIRSNMED
jgi:hypothetical protein